MSSDIASSSRPSSSTSSKPAPSRTSRRKEAENWDEDFEFSFRPQPKAVNSKAHSDNYLPKAKPIVLNGGSSPDSFGSWDDSPPSRPALLSNTQPKPSSKAAPPPLDIGISLPRNSPSHFSSLPSPSLPSPSPKPSTPYTATAISDGSSDLAPLPSEMARSMSSTANATVSRNKLVKRHPSSSFLPMRHTNTSVSSISSASHPNRSSPHLPRSPSSERMPPPPLPLGLTRSRSKGKGRPVSRGPDGVRISNIPFSPSQEAFVDGERKPGFWKRLSGVPSDRKVNEGYASHRRRRSSSIGASSSSALSSSPHPPLPPLPPNLRSTSAASITSAVSQVSSASASSSNRSGPASALSSILRRSTSSLSKRSDNSGKTPPSAYHPTFQTSPSPASSPFLRELSKDNIATSPPTSHSFSRGFHLPSPSPGSPYSPSLEAQSRSILSPPPPLPHSSSFPIPLKPQTGIDSDTETELEDLEATPRRRKKIRPVSALPAPRSTSKGWDGEGWRGFGELQSATSVQHDERSESRSSYHRPTASEIPNPSSPRSAGFSAATSSTLRRLSSISKKHGRRLSGGFKFGTNSSASSNESRKGSGQPLETVVGSPSKSTRPALPPPDFPNPASDTVFVAEIRAGSVSAPNSSFKSSTVGKAEGHPFGMIASISEDAGLSVKKEKHRRRKSGGDLIIPAHVKEKQKGFEEGRGAIKRFAGGVESLRALVDIHEQLQKKVNSGNSERDRDMFNALEVEFEQYWEMAMVLIEVGATGATPTTQPSVSSHSSPARSRRITLASDEAKLAADALSKMTLSPTREGINQTQRSSSLPDPEFDVGPPRASPDHWRASTGRADLSKRQLEILRTMLSPVPARPGLGSRGASTLSASSTGSVLPSALSSGRYGPSAGGRTPSGKSAASGVTFPSPPESNYVVPSGSFPSPLTASSLAQPTRPALKNRRSSKAGLAGLKEFLKSLKGSPSPGAGPPPLSLSVQPASRHSSQASSQAILPSPPTSPTTPYTPSFEEIRFPTSRSGYSAMQLTSPPLDTREDEYRQQDGQGTPQLRRVTAKLASPDKASSKRPSIRNIFRTSSGNWSELVRQAAAQPSQVPPLPTRTDSRTSGGRKSIDGRWSESIPGMPNTHQGTTIPRRPSNYGLNRSSSTKGKGKGSAKTPTSASFSMGPKSWKSPKKSSKKGEELAEVNTNNTANGLRPGSSSTSVSETGYGRAGEVERTVRPTRKSRIMGLGMPGSSSSSSLNVRSSRESSGKSAPVSAAASDVERQISASTQSSTLERHHGIQNGHHFGHENDEGGDGETSFRDADLGDGEEMDLMVALTPENLPQLLKYLGDCEGRLKEWREKAEGFLESKV